MCLVTLAGSSITHKCSQVLDDSPEEHGDTFDPELDVRLNYFYINC